jgi:hypothetical protein
VKHGQETGVLAYSVHGGRDRIIKGAVLLEKLLSGNSIIAASAMARRECYEKVSFFPLDMPWAGDWYLWCLFALYFDAAYFAEPMACYRDHALSMSSALMQGQVENCAEEDLAMPWVIKHKARETGHRRLSKTCLRAAVNEYLRITTKRYRGSRACMSLEQFEESLCRNTASETERNWVRARVYAGIADQYYWRGAFPLAKQFYLDGLRRDFWMPKALAKCLLVLLGKPGDVLRKSFRSSLNRAIAGLVRPAGRSC